MKKQKKWSPEAVMRNRRKRMARRLYKKNPLFAVQEIKDRFGVDYDEHSFFADQALKNGRRSKKKAGRSKITGKTRYLQKIQGQVRSALESGEEKTLQRIMQRYYLIAANKSKPWQIEARYSDGEKVRYFFPPKLWESDIRQFWNLVQTITKNAQGRKLIEQLHDKICKYVHFGD